jgi:mono/diheme cytochrome c family protein
MRKIGLLIVGLIAAGVAAHRPIAAAPDDVTFSRDIAPILYAHCVSCHRKGEVAPMPLFTYQEARPWARAIKEKVGSRQMPPWFADPALGSFENDARLADPEIARIGKWVDSGAPQGDPKDLPPPPHFTDGWQLGEPDYIIELPEVHIPAEGNDFFPTPNLTLDLKEDHWIRAIEIRPSAREVTHHSVLFSVSFNPLAGPPQFDVLGVWAVGTQPTIYPEGSGRWVRRGQMIRTNLHYHPNGKPQTDRTRVGLYFGSGELKKEVRATAAGNVFFTIPANASNHEVRGTWVADQDIEIVSFFPHMHLRGKDMRMTATYPGGRQETLLNVPAYDFNWQLFYRPKAPVALPRGTRLDVVAHYDNSPANKHNPDPTKTIRFGEASTAEMMFGAFEFTAAEGVSPIRSTDRSRLEALQMSFDPGAALLVEVPFQAARPSLLVFHLPRSGEGRMYVPSIGGMIIPAPIQELAWSGRAFQFNTALIGGAGAGFYTVNGTLNEDGSVRGEMRRRGNAQPPSYDFTGAANR